MMKTRLIIVILLLSISTFSEEKVVTFNWERVDGATGYILEVSRDNDFKDILKTYQTEATEVEYLPKRAGVYFFRVTPRFNNLALRESATVGKLNVRYQAPKIKKAEKEVHWQRVPEATKYLVKIKQKEGEEKVIEVDEPKLDSNLIGGQSDIEVIALSPSDRPISRSSFSKITFSPEELPTKRDLPLRYIALMTGVAQSELTSPVVTDVSKSGLIDTLEGAWSIGKTHNLALRVTGTSNQVTRDSSVVPELSYNYELFEKGRVLRYLGIAGKRETLSFIASNNLLNTDYIYYGTKIMGDISNNLSYQIDLEHTGGTFNLHQIYLDYKLSSLHTYMKLTRQSIVIESPSTRQESDFTGQVLSLGIGMAF